MKVKKRPVVLLLSKSGGGKDTQGDVLVKEHGFEMINSGAILRSLRELLPKLKKGSIDWYEVTEIQKIINAGKFIPTLPMACQWKAPLMDFVRNPKKIKGIVFTGSPRKLAEAWLIHEFFKNWPDAAEHFALYPLEIKLSDKEAFYRLSNRKQCGKCGKIFSAEELKTIKRCGKCGGKLIKRKDDSPEGIKSRLQEFRDYVIPVLDYFKKEKILKSISGEQSIKKVHKNLARAISL